MTSYVKLSRNDLLLTYKKFDFIPQLILEIKEFLQFGRLRPSMVITQDL